MSESEHRVHESELCDGANGEEDDEEYKEREDGGGEGRGGGVGEVRKKGISGDFRNAIKRRFRKRKKEKDKGDGEIIELPPARRRGRRIQFGGGGGSCYFCFLPPRTEESPETPTSDPNSETFSFEMLTTLIESNDFYCNECNPHI